MELRDYLYVVWRRKIVIIVVTLLVVGTTLGLSLLQTPIYASTARVLLRPTASVFDARTAQVQDPVLVQTEIQVFRSEQVQNLVRIRLEGTAPPIRVSSVSQTAVVEVTAEHAIPARAAAISNAYVAAYTEFRRDEATDAMLAAANDIQARIDGLQGEVRKLEAELAALPACTGANQPRECERRDHLNQDRDGLVSQLVPLRTRLNELQLGSSIASGPQVIAPAAPSAEPIRPQPVRNGLLGLGMGFALGVALAFMFDHFDDSIKSKEDVERLSLEIPVLGMIPTVTVWKNRSDPQIVSQAQPTSSAAEAYRSLRTSIRFIGLDRSMRTMQVTSPNASEGKTTTVANLAVALARAGERVVIVSGDLRRPRIHEFFDLPNEVGFMSVILGEVPLSAALQVVRGEPRLRLLPTGPVPANPSELLSSTRAAQVLAALRTEASIVLIDCPPVLPVTDAAVLSARVDGTLLVASVGTTTGKQVTRSIELLRQVNAPLVGIVLNGVGAQGGYGYHAYYGGSDPGAAPPTKRRKPGRDDGLAREA